MLVAGEVLFVQNKDGGQSDEDRDGHPKLRSKTIYTTAAAASTPGHMDAN